MSNPHEEEALGKAYDSRLMRRLLQYMRPYKWRVILALSLVAIVTPLELSPPIIFGWTIDRYFSPALKGTLPEASAWRGVVLVSIVSSCNASANKPCTTCALEFLRTCSACR